MAETSIKISLELVDKAAQKALSDFISKTGSADKGLDKLKKSGTSTFEQISIGIGKSAGIWEIFAGNLLANVAIKAFDTLKNAASALFQTFIVEGIDAAQKQQDAINSLNQALAQSGHFSKEASQDIQEFAESLQATTTVEDDVILKNAALIQSMGQLDKDGLKRATLAALNLSAALDKDLGSASEALGKASTGNVTALQKMGLEIRKGQTDAETFANTLKAVEERFGGAAAAKVNTFSGAMAQARNSFGDFTEEIGNLIVKNPVFISAINEGAKIIRELTLSAKEAGPGLMQSLGQTFIAINNIVGVSINVFDQFLRITTAMWRGLENSALLASLGVAKALNLVGLTSKTTVDTLKEQLVEKSKQTMDAFSESTGLGKASEAIAQIGVAAEGGFAKLQAGADGSVEPLNNTTKATKELSEEQKRSLENLKNFAGGLVKQAEDEKKLADQKIQVAKDTADIEQAILQEKFDQHLISHQEFLLRQAESNATFDLTKQAIDEQKFVDENVRLQAALSQNQITEQEFFIAKQQLAENFLASQSKRDAETKKRDAQAKKELLAAERTFNQAKVQAASDTFGNLATLMSTSNRKLFEIGKAAAITQATINTVMGISNALAGPPTGPPWPFNIALAASQGVALAVRVSQLASSKPPAFEDGGIVPGNSFSGDRVGARVNSGEMILNRSQQGNLFRMANGETGGDSSKIEALIIGLVNALESRPISVQIGEQEVFNVLRSGLNGGRAFA